jgi:hypothetical protein
MRVTSIATGASLNTRPDVPPARETPTTTQPPNAPSRHSDCCAHTHSAYGLCFLPACGDRVLVPVAMTGWPGGAAGRKMLFCGAVRLAGLGLGVVAD